MTEARRPLDAETDQLLSELCRLIDNLVERDQSWKFAEPGSALAEDDKRLPEFEPSTIARSGLIGAVDHLYSASILMRSGVLPARAIFTLMRGALENASVAVWIIAPKGRVERLRRALLWHAANIKFREKLLILPRMTPATLPHGN